MRSDSQTFWQSDSLTGWMSESVTGRQSVNPTLRLCESMKSWKAVGLLVWQSCSQKVLLTVGQYGSLTVWHTKEEETIFFLQHQCIFVIEILNWNKMQYLWRLETNNKSFCQTKTFSLFEVPYLTRWNFFSAKLFIIFVTQPWKMHLLLYQDFSLKNTLV